MRSSTRNPAAPASIARCACLAAIAVLASSSTSRADSSSSFTEKLSQRDRTRKTFPLNQSFRKGSLADLVNADLARAQALGRVDPQVSLDGGNTNIMAAFAQVSNDAVTTIPTDISIDNAIGSYFVNMGVGTPEVQQPKMVIDTGSAVTWVGGLASGNDPGFDPTKSSSSLNTGFGINETYGIGGFDGNAYTETVTFQGSQGPVAATQQVIGVATSQQGYSGTSGILGLGPASQASNSLYVKATGQHFTSQVPTVTDTLFADGEIPDNVVSLSFRPITSTDSSATTGAGTMTFGGANPADYNGDIKYIPKSTDPTVANYWGLGVDSVTIDTLDGEAVRTTTLSSGPTVGIVDSASTFFALPQSVYQAYMAAYPGTYATQGYMLIPQAQVPRIGNMTINMGGNEFIFSPSAQLFPAEIQKAFTGTTPESLGYNIAVFSNYGAGTGNEYTFGMYFIERFYSVFDTTNQQIGLAYTDYTFEKTTDLTSFRRTRRAHREHKKSTEWADGKARLAQLGKRSPFAGSSAKVAAVRALSGLKV